jgi:hypothetical protein
MAIRRSTAPAAAKGAKPLAKPGLKAAPAKAPAPAKEEAAESGKITVTRTYGEQTDQADEELEIVRFVGPVAHASVNIGVTRNVGNFESVKVGVMVTLPCYAEEIDDAFAVATAKAIEKANDAFNAVAELEGADEEPPAKSGKGKAKKKAADENEEEETTDETTDEAEEASEGEEEGITEDYIRGLDRDDLEAFIKENEIDVKPAKIKKLKDLQDAVWEQVEAMQASSEDSGDGENTESEDGETETDEEAGEGGAEESSPYTEDELKEASVKDLKGVLDEWGIKHPKAPNEKALKAALIKAILKHQEEAASEGDDE